MVKRSSIILVLILITTITPADNHLQVLLTTKAATFSSTQDVIVIVVFVNTGDQPIRIHTPAVPKQSLPDQLFTVTVDGAEVKYIGPVFKRVAPSLRHTVIVEPGESISGSMSLSSAYDLGKSGKYGVRYDVEGSRVIFESTEMRKELYGTDQVQSNTLVLDVMGRANTERAKVALTDSKKAYGLNRYASCSTAQRSLLSISRSVALTYAVTAYNYMSTKMSRILERYPTWFGTYSQSRWNKVRSNFLKIRNGLNIATILFDCSCTDNDTYAYVHIDNPYVIYICGVFWEAPLNGTDSKGGTLVHEISHFTVVAGLTDHAYGQSACKVLAVNNPVKAIQNAESYQYFAENNPRLT